jgi:hypothetical protein
MHVESRDVGFLACSQKKKKCFSIFDEGGVDMCKKLIFICLMVAAAATIASAGNIRYVDANDSGSDPLVAGNTTLCSAPGVPWTSSTANDGTDGLWRKRGGLANGQAGTSQPYRNIFCANDATSGTPNTENVATLVTKINVPVELQGRTLEVYAYFWSDTSQWRIRAAIAENGVCPEVPMPLYYANTLDWMLETEPLGPNNGQAPVANMADFYCLEAPCMVVEGNRTMYAADLGSTVAGAVIEVCIDSDDYTSHLVPPYASTWNARTWYDGVGYTPEPATIALLGLGGLALLRRKHA